MPNITIGNQNKIALQLFFKNSANTYQLDSSAIIEKSFTMEQLYGNGNDNIIMDCSLIDSEVVTIVYQDHLLIIKTPANVTILLSGYTPAHGIHIESAGGFALVDGPDLDLNMGMYVNAHAVVIDLTVTSPDFLTFIANKDENSMVDISQPLTTDKLHILTSTLNLGSVVTASTASIDCKEFKPTATSSLLIKDCYSASATEDVLLMPGCKTWRAFIEDKIYESRRPKIIIGDAKLAGSLSFSNADVYIKSTLQFLPGSSSVFDSIQLYADMLQIDKKAKVGGNNTSFHIKKNFDVDGECIIDQLVISSADATISGLLWGGESLAMSIKEVANFNGIVGSKQTKIHTKYLLATAILGNEMLFYKTFVNGGIIGTSNLSINALASLRAGGAYLYGSNTNITGGIDIDLLSYVRSYNFIKNVLYESDFGLKVPCSPENWLDLINANKMLRVAEMIGSNFPILRGLTAAYNVATSVAPLCHEALSSAISSIRRDPNLAKHLFNLGVAGVTAANSGVKSAKGGFTSVVNIAIGEWSSDAAKELIDAMLNAQGVYMHGNMLMSQATNALIFTNDMQNHVVFNPDLTIANACDLSSKTRSAAADTFATANKFKADSEYRKQVFTDTYDSVKAQFTNNVFSLVEPVLNAELDSDNDAKDKKRTVGEAAKDVIANHVSAIANTPCTIVNSVMDTVNSIASINTTDSATAVFTSAKKKVDLLSTAAFSVLGCKESIAPIQRPTLDSEFLWCMSKETAQLLAPSIYTTSWMSDHGGFTLGGTSIVNCGFYRNSGLTVALGTSIHCMYDLHNRGGIFSFRHAETARDRYNYGVVGTYDLRLTLRDNFEHGVTDSTTKLLFDVRNNCIAKDATFRSAGQTYGHITGDLNSYGYLDLANGNVKVDGEAYFADSSVSDLYNIHLQAKNIERAHGSNMQYTGNFKLEAEHVSSGLTSTLVGGKNSVFVSVSETAECLGIEDHVKTLQIVKKMPMAESLDLLHGEGKHKNKKASERFCVETESKEAVFLDHFGRGPTVAVSLKTAGEITHAVQYDGAGLSLETTAGNLHIMKDINAVDNVVLKASGDVNKAGISVASKHANVVTDAGGIVDNSNGGVISAKQGAVLVTGSTVNNNCGALGERSLIEGNLALVEATVGNVENTGSSIKGDKFVSVKALEDVNNVAKESRKLHGENTYTHYQAAEISGGDVYVHAKGKVHNTASIIKAAFKTIVAGDRGVLMTTRSNVYKDYDYRVDHGQLNKTYHRGEATEYGIASVGGQEVEILSSESGVTLHGVNTIAKDGTKIYAKCDVILDSHVSKEKHSITEVKVKGLYKKTTEVTTEVEKINIVATDTGKIHVRSEEGRVVGTGNLFLGGGEASLLVESQKGIELTLKNLNHTITEKTKKVDFHIAGQAIIDRSNKSAMDRMSAASSLIGTANTVLQSDNPAEAVANLNNLASEASRTLAQVVGEGGVADVIKEHITADLTVTASNSLTDLQAQGGGGISGIKYVEAVGGEGDVKIGHDLNGIAKMKVQAIKLLITNNTLTSSNKHVEVSASASIDATGAQNYGAAASNGSSFSTTQTQTKMNVNDLVLDVDVFELDGAKATVGAISGRADTIITRDKLDTSQAKDQSISVDAIGNVSGSVVNAKSQEVGATGSLEVEDGIDPNTFTVKEYVSFGSVSTLLNTPEIIQKHIALDEYSKRLGGSLGGNLNQVNSASASEINLSVGIDHKDYKASVGQNGRTIIKDQKFDAKVKFVLPKELFSQNQQPEQRAQLEPLVLLTTPEDIIENSESNSNSAPEPQAGQAATFLDDLRGKRDYIKQLESETGKIFTDEEKRQIRKQIKVKYNDTNTGVVVYVPNGKLILNQQNTMPVISNMGWTNELMFIRAISGNVPATSGVRIAEGNPAQSRFVNKAVSFIGSGAVNIVGRFGLGFSLFFHTSDLGEADPYKTIHSAEDDRSTGHEVPKFPTTLVTPVVDQKAKGNGRLETPIHSNLDGDVLPGKSLNGDGVDYRPLVTPMYDTRKTTSIVHLKEFVDRSIFGPSGKPKIHGKHHKSKKEAREAAQLEGSGEPVHHASQQNLDAPHFHPTDRSGEKIAGGTHHYYPGNNINRNDGL